MLISEFGAVLIFAIVAILFMAGGLFASWLLRPRRPNEEKLTTYECGEEPVGTAWGQFNARFYAVALIFVLFDAELIFLFPWATVFGQEELIKQTNGTWGWFALVEMFLFVGILAIGLAYAWAKGLLDWAKPQPNKMTSPSKVPISAYQDVQQGKYDVVSKK